jgi:L-serine dehydratase
MQITTGENILKICNERNQHIYDVILNYEINRSDQSASQVQHKMEDYLQVMREAVKKGLDETDDTIKGKIIGGEAKKLKKRYKIQNPVCGYTMAEAISFALSVMEVNVSMGRIIAAPTAGSCGVLPAVLLSLEKTHDVSKEQLIQGLLTASGVGMVIAKNASLSGAEGGCQAEIGSAAAMAAAAVVEMLGGTPKQAFHGAAIALKNLMGLICDPIAGLVEAPCSKRNAIGTANALISAEMALAGIESVVPFDEVVIAMHSVGRMMPCALRETAEGGIAVTPTGKKLKKQILNI